MLNIINITICENKGSLSSLDRGGAICKFPCLLTPPSPIPSLPSPRSPHSIPIKGAKVVGGRRSAVGGGWGGWGSGED